MDPQPESNGRIFIRLGTFAAGEETRFWNGKL